MLASTRQREEELQGELAKVVARSADGVFQPERGQKPLSVSQLEQIVETIRPDEWRADRAHALREVLRDAAVRLSHEISLLTKVTYTELAWAEYNLNNEPLSHVDGHRHAYLRNQLFQSKGEVHSKSSLRNWSKKLREKLAVELLSMERRALELPFTSTLPGLIDRPEYMTAIREHVQTDAKIICLWGEPGTGKSTLAAQAGAELRLGNVVTLRAAESRILQDDIVDFLIAEGMDPSSWSDAYCRSKLRAVLAKQMRSGIVILDDVYDEDLVWSLVPQAPVVPVIVTMRHRPADPAYLSVELHDFTVEQALDLVHGQLANCTEEQAKRLIGALGCRPLALNHLIGYVSEASGVELDDLIATFAESVTQGLALIAPPERQQQNLLRLYSEILRTIQEQNRSAGEVLRCLLVSTGHSGQTDAGLLRSYFMSMNPGPIGAIALGSGLRVLQHYGLATSKDHYWSMHAFTRQVMSEQLSRHLTRYTTAFVIHLASDAFSEDEWNRRDRRRYPFLLHKEIMACRNLSHEWKYLLCVDAWTWVAIQKGSTDVNVETYSTIRYEVDPSKSRIYRIDYDSGKRTSIQGAELDYLARMTSLYRSVVLMAVYSYADYSGRNATVDGILGAIARTSNVRDLTIIESAAKDAPAIASDKDAPSVILGAIETRLQELGQGDITGATS